MPDYDKSPGSTLRAPAADAASLAVAAAKQELVVRETRRLASQAEERAAGRVAQAEAIAREANDTRANLANINKGVITAAAVILGLGAYFLFRKRA